MTYSGPFFPASGCFEPFELGVNECLSVFGKDAQGFKSAREKVPDSEKEFGLQLAVYKRLKLFLELLPFGVEL